MQRLEKKTTLHSSRFASVKCKSQWGCNGYLVHMSKWDNPRSLNIHVCSQAGANAALTSLVYPSHTPHNTQPRACAHESICPRYRHLRWKYTAKYTAKHAACACMVKERPNTMHSTADLTVNRGEVCPWSKRRG